MQLSPMKLSRTGRLFPAVAVAVRLLLLVLFIVSIIAVSGCVQGRGQPRGWSGVAVDGDTLFVGSMEGKLVSAKISTHARQWADVTLETTQRSGGFGCAPSSSVVAIYGTPAISGDSVYVAGYDGRIRAINTNSGTLDWQYPAKGEPGLKPIVGGVAAAGGKVFFGASDGKVYAVDETTHVDAWGEPFETGDKIWSTPVIGGDTLYITSFDKKLYALDIADGSKSWEFATEGAIAATPLLYNGTLYFGSFDRHFYAVNATTGRQLWQFPLNDESERNPRKWFWAKAVANDNTIYAPCLDGKVYILDAVTGAELTDAIDVKSPLASSPVLVNKAVVIASEAGNVYAIDTKTNQVKMLAELGEKEEISSPLAASENVVFVHTLKDETLYALNAESGVIMWKLTLSSK